MWPLTTERQHRYQTCRDEDCQRFACRVYREGREDGYEDGYEVGHAAGYARGYADGAASRKVSPR